MAEFRIPAADWPAHLSDALRKASPGDTVTVGTEPIRLLAESAAESMGKAGVTILVSPCAATEATS
jgi:hypothetical protein